MMINIVGESNEKSRLFFHNNWYLVYNNRCFIDIKNKARKVTWRYYNQEGKFCYLHTNYYYVDNKLRYKPYIISNR